VKDLHVKNMPLYEKLSGAMDLTVLPSGLVSVRIWGNRNGHDN
jgi:hypothetical protein